MNEFSIRLGEVIKELKLTPTFIRLDYCNRFNTTVSAKQFKAWISGTEEPPLQFIAWFCKNARISGDYILGLSDYISEPLSLSELLWDLSDEQRTAIELPLAAFRKANAAKAEEA